MARVLPISRLLLGVTGSVAVVALPSFLIHLRSLGVGQVIVMMSDAATKLMSVRSMELFSGMPVFTDSFEEKGGVRVPHIELAKWADMMLVMPATANSIARVAAGLCDNLITLTVLTMERPVLFVPAMNERMWRSRVVQRNVDTLRGLGHAIIPPGQGIEVATMEATEGALPDFDAVIAAMRQVMAEYTTQPTDRGEK